MKLSYPPKPEEIADLVHQIALRVSTGGNKQLRIDFADEVLAELYQDRPKAKVPIINMYDRSKGEFVPWLKKVLKKLWLNKVRKSSAWRRIQSSNEVQELENLPEYRSSLSREKETPPMLSNADCDRIRAWPPRVRVELLLISGIYNNISEAFWAECRDEALKTYEHLKTVTLDEIRTQLLNFDSYTKRITTIAKLILNIRTNTLSQRWIRFNENLAELDYFQNLRDNLD